MQFLIAVAIWLGHGFVSFIIVRYARKEKISPWTILLGWLHMLMLLAIVFTELVYSATDDKG